MEKIRKQSYVGGLIWIFSGLILLSYASVGLLGYQIPGIENLVSFINSISGKWLYLAAFLTLFIEGIYIIGNVFPGTTLALVLTILAHGRGLDALTATTFFVFLGWTIAGILNILFAKNVTRLFLKKYLPERGVENVASITWFPIFRSNMEVSQIIEGHSASEVFLSSLKIKAITCFCLIFYSYIVKLFIDVNNVSNENGFLSLMVIALINCAFGSFKIWKYYKQKTA